MDEAIPILIALSALVDEQVKQRCLKSGFDLVLEAPLS
jgi:CheY-like chemotaxis protein